MPNLNIQQHLLTPNPYSRPSLVLRTVHKIIIHWVANPATSAIANRNYFENLKHGTRGVYASAHYIVGLDGEILQCIPDTELAYHAKNANTYSLCVEVCHPDWEGQFSSTTYEALIHLLAKLCMTYNLDPAKDLLRHYDITGKVCPKYYVHHPALWTLLKADVMHILNQTYLSLTPHTNLEPLPICLLLNDKQKTVYSFLYKDEHYVRLRDLQDDCLKVGYDKLRRMPILLINNFS